jgi:hypothetical protein
MIAAPRPRVHSFVTRPHSTRNSTQLRKLPSKVSISIKIDIKSPRWDLRDTSNANAATGRMLKLTCGPQKSSSSWAVVTNIWPYRTTKQQQQQHQQQPPPRSGRLDKSFPDPFPLTKYSNFVIFFIEKLCKFHSNSRDDKLNEHSDQ